ncbi:helix-turn-helix domain-containing protein [Streptomyces sp. WAC 00631]|uniref:helix-turn-helix domain-containing protein n=1 Tax=unclassified Streptomyces TaxID=2593676 RepID=UPI000F79252A|nr:MULTISPECIES: helix-turn-helix transcriptional regulator [unclassified Streptomyces]MCC5037116.1 helix-turn-helix domain-containing protein [Streptomyces sp. WAC 00631]MCC9737720.1 helix-turn-helix domain-containing protein [Streptomyces sp. MNU89]
MNALTEPDDALPVRRYLDRPEAGPTVLRIVVGAQLRRLRRERGITPEAAGRAIRASHAKISRLERGQVGFKTRDLEDLLTLYGVHDPDERSDYLTLGRRANRPGWWHEYSDVLEDWFELHIGLEESAQLIRTYEVQFLPGLLQTEAYARAVTRIGYPDAPRRKIDRLVELRLARQKLLTRPDAPKLWAVVDEAVLRRPFGGPEVMRAQLEHLLAVSELPSVSLQVAPFSVGANAAAGTPVTLLRFREPDLPDKVYLEQLTGAVYLDKREDVDQYGLIMERLCAEAEPPEESREFLRELLGREY